MNQARISNQIVAVIAILLASSMTFAAFFLSRSDHDLKLVSLTAVIALGSGLMGIAGTLLVGIQAYRRLTNPSPEPPSPTTPTQP